MDTLVIDIETYSDVSLPDCGVHRYAASEQFEILLFAYSLNDEPTQIIDLASGEKIPDEIMEYLTDDSVIKTAYNAAFERNCINRFFGLSLKPEGWRCTLVQASMLSLPLSLEGVGEALNLDKKKMSEGKDLIRYFCMPCKTTKATGAGQETFRPMLLRSGSCSRHTASVTWMWKNRSGINLRSFRYRTGSRNSTAWTKGSMTGASWWIRNLSDTLWHATFCIRRR